MKVRYSALATSLAVALLPATLVAQSVKGGASRLQATAPWAQSISSHNTAVSELRGGGPENDACGSATAQNLAMGGSLTFTGTTTGATNDNDFAPGSIFVTDPANNIPTVWHAFTISECANVTVAYCNTDPGFGNVWVFLALECPANEPIIATTTSWTLCAQENITMTYSSLQAGTYYLPVMYDATTANGPYSIDVSAVACPVAEPYCTNIFTITEDIEPICRVQFAGIDNTSCADVDCGPAFEDFTNLAPAEVTTGQSYAMTVTGNTAGNYANYITAFVDWDQDGTFEASYQIGTFSNTVCTIEATGQIDVPANAAEGTTRMRIIKDWAGSVTYPADPCGVYDYGQAEDYLVNVTVVIGMEETSGANWSVFPNPGTGDLTIVSGNVNGRVQVEVLDMTGRLVSAEQHAVTSGGQTALNMADRLAAGTYVLRLTSEAGRYEQRIVVR